MFYTNKKVLVTGGSGFVGTAIVKQLLESGAHVRIPVRNRKPVIVHPNIETMQADLSIHEECVKAATGVEYVFHAAGAVAAAAVNATNPMSAITSNLVLTVRMLEAAWQTGVDRFLLFSSSTAYPAADHAVKEEEMWGGPTYPFYFGYGWMRRYLERIAEFVGQKSSLKIALVRPTAVYGPWDNFDSHSGHVIPALIKRALEKENPFVVWGTGDEVRDFLFIDDLARGCLTMLEKHACCDPVNIGYGSAVTIKQIVEIILRETGHDSAKVSYDSTKPVAIPFRMVDITKSQKLFKFKPSVSLEQGLIATIGWYLDSIKKPA
jgi:GDP-L-fucose synthase